MTPQEQNIAIAEACGWKKVHQEPISTPGKQQYIWIYRHKETHEAKPPYEHDRGVSLPNYYEDLNACHEMEKKLSNDERTDYIRLLNAGDFSCRRLAFAPAPQRCEAFLRTIGKWKDQSK